MFILKKTFIEQFYRPVTILLTILSGHIYHGPYHLYTAIPDQDATMVTQALQYNSGLGITYLDHPGATLIIVFGYWLKILNLFDPNIPIYWNPSNYSDLEQIYFAAIMAGRSLNGLIIALIILCICHLSEMDKLLDRSKILHTILLVAILTMPYTFLSSLIIRTEPISILSLLVAFTILQECQKNYTTMAKMSLCMMAGIFTYISLIGKIQAIFMIPIFSSCLILKNDCDSAFLKNIKPGITKLHLFIFGLFIAIGFAGLRSSLIYNIGIIDLALILMIPLSIALPVLHIKQRLSNVYFLLAIYIGFFLPFTFQYLLGSTLINFPIINITYWTSQFTSTMHIELGQVAILLNPIFYNRLTWIWCFAILCFLCFAGFKNKLSNILASTQFIGGIILMIILFTSRYNSAVPGYYGVFLEISVIYSLSFFITRYVLINYSPLLHNFKIAIYSSFLVLICLLNFNVVVQELSSCLISLNLPWCGDIEQFWDNAQYSSLIPIGNKIDH